MLSRIDEDIVSFHVSKQVARIIVHTQEELIHEFSAKGVLRPRDAEFLQEEIRKNSERLYAEWLTRCTEVNEGGMYSDHMGEIPRNSVTNATNTNTTNTYTGGGNYLHVDTQLHTPIPLEIEKISPSLDGLV